MKRVLTEETCTFDKNIYIYIIRKNWLSDIIVSQ